MIVVNDTEVVGGTVGVDGVVVASGSGDYDGSVILGGSVVTVTVL